ncbi:MAG: hypothetical protein HY074_09565 [Deltaproteobacteria bacterium]|nr:hypothetical protein [Deltaproteobacteria bacterium]
MRHTGLSLNIRGNAMFDKVSNSVTVAALSLMATLCMGVDSCSEPKEYCKFYDAKADQTECTTYCDKNKDFAGDKDRENLVRSCQLGQLGYISSVHLSVAEALLGCDRKFKDNTGAAIACRAGVTAEELRASKTPHRSAGTSNDRETGNGK